jgi:hypothetical protein
MSLMRLPVQLLLTVASNVPRGPGDASADRNLSGIKEAISPETRTSLSVVNRDPGWPVSRGEESAHWFDLTSSQGRSRAKLAPLWRARRPVGIGNVRDVDGRLVGFHDILVLIRGESSWRASGLPGSWAISGKGFALSLAWCAESSRSGRGLRGRNLFKIRQFHWDSLVGDSRRGRECHLSHHHGRERGLRDAQCSLGDVPLSEM